MKPRPGPPARRRVRDAPRCPLAKAELLDCYSTSPRGADASVSERVGVRAGAIRSHERPLTPRRSPLERGRLSTPYCGAFSRSREKASPVNFRSSRSRRSIRESSSSRPKRPSAALTRIRSHSGPSVSQHSHQRDCAGRAIAGRRRPYRVRFAPKPR
jgi:hypothetical protein